MFIQLLSKYVTANQLTVARILAIPVIYVLTAMDTPMSLFIGATLFTLACVTDYLDGELARQTEETMIGKLLDPVADKVLVSTVLVLLASMGRVDAWIAAVLIAREFAVSGLRSIAINEGVVIAASAGAKVKTATQMFALGFLILHFNYFGFPSRAVGLTLLWISLGYSLWTGGHYFWGYFKATK